LTDFVGRPMGEPLAVFELVAVVKAVTVIGGNRISKKMSLLAFSFDKTLKLHCLSKGQKEQTYLMSLLWKKL